MKKFLVVGCGGSGAKTQAYMIDQLKAYLRRVDPDIDRLPDAWQFVSIDSPLEAETISGVPNVQQSGGTYVSVGKSQHYNEYDTGISRTLGNAGALGEIATWAERNPRTRNTPISDGAGQYRAIGRMLTIGSFQKIRDGLVAAAHTLNRIETNSELNELNYKITGQYQDGTDQTPIVFVISSMAGGTGASMALDVCRILSSIDGIQAGKTAVFMFTPEVFEAVDKDKVTGTRGNALAMFGEVYTAQTGNALEHDQTLLRAMGLPVGSSASTFNRLFPIGARTGANKSLFGDGTPGDIYRGLARSLAALMTSESASNSFVQFDLGNTGTESGDRSLLGWGSKDETKWELIPWGSMGFAELSMGRDRYAEYSAQRLARSVFDHLLEGHIDKDDPATANEQLERRLNDRRQGFFHDCWLPAAANEPAAANWLQGFFNSQTVQIVRQAQATLKSRIQQPDGMKSVEWAGLVRQRLAQSNGIMRGQIDAFAEQIVFDFSDQFADNVLHVLEQDLSRKGLAYTQALANELTMLLKDGLVATLRQLGAYTATHDPVAATPELEMLLQPLNGRGNVNNSAQLVDQIVESYGNSLAQYYWEAMAKRLSPVLDDFRQNFLAQLQRELSKVHRNLEEKASNLAKSNALADVSTDEPLLWPSDGDELVDQRFFESKNVKLISKVEEFPNDYVGHIIATISETDGAQLPFEDAREIAIREIVLGAWETTGGLKAPENTLAPKKSDSYEARGNRAGWVARDLLRDPKGGEPREPRTGAFEIRLRPEDLLARTRQWLSRPGEPFEKFISMGLRSYLSRDEAPNDTVYNERLVRLRQAFSECLGLARPLASVNKDMLGRIYGDPNEVYNFKFSEVPFEGLEAKDSLLSVLSNSASYSEKSRGEFENSLNSADHLQSFTIFGSYPNYSPVVFSSLFPAIGKQINQQRGRLDEFWTLRRARPLAAALPLSKEELRAMIGGWLIGDLTGHIYINGANQADGKAYIWSERKKNWIPFVDYMLTPRPQFRADYDWLPAILESIFIAYANIQDIPTGGQIGDSLLPYMTLRGLYDDGREGPTTGGIDLAAVRVLHKWLTTGVSPLNPNPQQENDPGMEERKKFAIAKLQWWQQLSLTFISKDGVGALPGSMGYDKPWARVTDRQYASNMPLFRDIAEEVYEMASDVIRQVEKAAVYQPPAQPQVQAPGAFGADGGLGAPSAPAMPTMPTMPTMPSMPSTPPATPPAAAPSMPPATPPATPPASMPSSPNPQPNSFEGGTPPAQGTPDFPTGPNPFGDSNNQGNTGFNPMGGAS